MPSTIPFAIQNASASAVIDAARTLRRDCFPGGRWIGPRNRYAINTVKRITADAPRRTPPSPKSLQLSQYIAASVILHCFDGWSYLSHSVESLLDGDIATAVHLAYYAELRAAMSFLASEGISIFDYKHFWCDNTGNYNVFCGSTHTVVWQALEEWAVSSARRTSSLSERGLPSEHD